MLIGYVEKVSTLPKRVVAITYNEAVQDFFKVPQVPYLGGVKHTARVQTSYLADEGEGVLRPLKLVVIKKGEEARCN